jgi:pimeloyl-ACP methyl ester carboxylesterase
VLAAICLLLALPPMPVPAVSSDVGSLAGAASPAAAASGSIKVSYYSTTDGWPLSFTEWLPAGYAAGGSYPLAVYLHGELGTNSSWVPGGVSSGLQSQSWGPGVIAAARVHGFLLIALNTRTRAGYYVNSPYTGPQEKDVLDAIAVEEARRNVSGVFLFGNSMGAEGALVLAGDHPGEFAGVGSVAGCPDAYETLQYREAVGNTSGVAESLQPTGGLWPNQSAASDALFHSLSSARFYPQNLSNLRLYYVAGGQDRSCPNNSTSYGFEQTTDTVLLPTCAIAQRVGEPSNCTVPLSILSGNDPQQYLWRFDYVATGGHTGSILDPGDMFAFWLGAEPGGYVCGAPGAGPTPCARPGNPTGPFTTQYYTSSVDGTLLSYYEWLPAGYTSNERLPLLMFLHGKGYQGNSIWTVPAGAASVTDALAAGFLVVSLNTRNASGFYVNSPYTGPQEQDVLDAIAHEKALRTVGSVYLYGFSMGTMGAISIASHHPGLVRGIVLVAPCTDLYEVQAYKISVNRSSDLDPFLNTTGGFLANQSSYADGETYYLSSMRFYPQNLSSVRLYVVAGGADEDCPNNPAIWGYQEANNTLVNSTCLSASSLAEPAQCTTPLGNLSLLHGSRYHFRFVFEAAGTHTLAMLDPADLIAYLLGTVPDGVYDASVGGTPLPASTT